MPAPRRQKLSDLELLQRLWNRLGHEIVSSSRRNDSVPRTDLASRRGSLVKGAAGCRRGNSTIEGANLCTQSRIVSDQGTWLRSWNVNLALGRFALAAFGRCCGGLLRLGERDVVARLRTIELRHHRSTRAPRSCQPL